jgi:hypothetical protein
MKMYELLHVDVIVAAVEVAPARGVLEVVAIGNTG